MLEEREKIEELLVMILRSELENYLNLRFLCFLVVASWRPYSEIKLDGN